MASPQGLRGRRQVRRRTRWPTSSSSSAVDPASYVTTSSSRPPRRSRARLLQPGQEGLVVSKATYDQAQEEVGSGAQDWGPRSSSPEWGSAGFKIRSVPLVGVIGATRSESEATELHLLRRRKHGPHTHGPHPRERRGTRPSPMSRRTSWPPARTTSSGARPSSTASLGPTAPKAVAPASAPAVKKQVQVDSGAWYFAMARHQEPERRGGHHSASLNALVRPGGHRGNQASNWKVAAGPFGSRASTS